jgi:dTMP kinase
VLAHREDASLVSLHPLVLKARAEEENEQAKLRAEYQVLKRALDAGGLSAVLLKSVGVAPSFPYKSDNLDLLFSPPDVEKARELLLSLGYVELRNVEEPHKYLFRRFRGGRSLIAVHVHEHVGWVTSFLDEESLWARSRAAEDDPLVVHPGPEDGLLITLAHSFFEDKTFSLWDMAKAAHCLRQNIDWAEVKRIASRRGWLSGLRAALLFYARLENLVFGMTTVSPEQLEKMRSGHERGAGFRPGRSVEKISSPAASPFPVPFALSKRLFFSKLWHDPSRRFGRRLKDIVLHTANGLWLRLGIGSQKRMLITFSGIDGSGKTTQARALQAAFAICQIKSRYVWSRAGSTRWFGIWTRLDKKRPADPPILPAAGDRFELQQRRFRSSLLRWGYRWLTAAELLMFYGRRVRWPLLRGRVVICDRYVFDALADWAAYFNDQSIGLGSAARILGALSPRPHLAYWVDVSPAVVVRRQEDRMSENFLMAQADVYRRLSESLGLRRLDGHQSWEALSEEIARQVLTLYFSDYRTRLNGLFLKNPGQWK